MQNFLQRKKSSKGNRILPPNSINKNGKKHKKNMGKLDQKQDYNRKEIKTIL